MPTGLLSQQDKNAIILSKFACVSLIVNEEPNSVVSQCVVEVGEGGGKFILFMRKKKNFLIMRCTTRSMNALGTSFCLGRKNKRCAARLRAELQLSRLWAKSCPNKI